MRTHTELRAYGVNGTATAAKLRHLASPRLSGTVANRRMNRRRGVAIARHLSEDGPACRSNLMPCCLMSCGPGSSRPWNLTKSRAVCGQHTASHLGDPRIERLILERWTVERLRQAIKDEAQVRFVFAQNALVACRLLRVHAGSSRASDGPANVARVPHLSALPA